MVQFGYRSIRGYTRLNRLNRRRCSILITRDVNFVFFPEIDFRFEKIDFISIIEFWFCASSLTVLMLQSHYVLART